MKIRRLQRGILMHLIKRGRPIEREIIMAILGNGVRKYKHDLPTEFQVEGEQAMKDFQKIFPVTLCRTLLGKGNLPQIKTEP